MVAMMVLDIFYLLEWVRDSKAGDNRVTRHPLLRSACASTSFSNPAAGQRRWTEIFLKCPDTLWAWNAVGGGSCVPGPYVWIARAGGKRVAIRGIKHTSRKRVPPFGIFFESFLQSPAILI